MLSCRLVLVGGVQRLDFFFELRVAVASRLAGADHLGIVFVGVQRSV